MSRYPSVEAYYKDASSSQRVGDVSIPLLVLSARDDPLAFIEALPTEKLVANPNCLTAITSGGGHIGWTGIEGRRSCRKSVSLILVKASIFEIVAFFLLLLLLSHFKIFLYSLY